MMLQRMCRACGRSFSGGPRSWHCPSCRAERRAEQLHAHRARRRAGQSRQIGSANHCARCGAVYTVEGGLQRYCPACAPDMVAEHDRQEGRAYYYANKSTINPLRYAKRKLPHRACIVCGVMFDPAGTKNRKCPKCRK